MLPVCNLGDSTGTDSLDSSILSFLDPDFKNVSFLFNQLNELEDKVNFDDKGY